MNTNANPLYRYVVTADRTYLPLLERELTEITGKSAVTKHQWVEFEGDLNDGYKAVLCSRIASRVILVLAENEVNNQEELYQEALQFPWEDHFSTATTFAIFASLHKSFLDHSGFTAQKFKDGIVDRFRQEFDVRPQVDADNPEISIRLWLRKTTLTFGLDLAGASLHQRGYRTEQVVAPLKENLAAAILKSCGIDEGNFDTIVDPMCGSGTLLIEAASILLKRKPNTYRRKPGSPGWYGHELSQFRALVKGFEEQEEAWIPKTKIIGYDRDPKAVKAARANVEAAGLHGIIHIEKRDVLDTSEESSLKPAVKGLVIVNPPYGERLDSPYTLIPVYASMGEFFRNQCAGWHAAVLTSDERLARATGLKAQKINALSNGPIKTKLYQFDIFDQSTRAGEREDAPKDDPAFYNRVQKNYKRLKKALKSQRIEAYRVYDRDIPEYAFSMDIYGDRIHLQEWEAPKSVNRAAADKRTGIALRAARRFAREVLGSSTPRVTLKERRRRRGKEQYEKLQERKNYFKVSEGDATLLVNLEDYLDTGLFLDHRPIRLQLAKEAEGKSFLNLFCYTASVTVHAALGGASHSLSVDMSNTYLDWARRNFSVNKLDPRDHQLERADCVKWLEETDERFDIIFMDPPAYSRSKKMEEDLDIQRDHATLISSAMKLLQPGGRLYFSTNLRTFTIDDSIKELFQIKDLTEASIPADFKRAKSIHKLYRIEAKG